MAEAHPVGFQWVMEAKKRGAKIIHVDPRFSRTSAVAHLHVPIRAGADIAFVGGLINYVLQNNKYFRDYVVAYTNAPDDHRRGLQGHRGSRRALLRLGPRAPDLRLGDLALPGRRGDRAGQRRPRHAAARQAGGPGGGPRRGARLRRRGRAPGPGPRPHDCSIRAACSRSSSGTSPGTRRTWWRRWPGSPRRSSSRWPRPSRRTPAGTGPPRSCTAWAGPSTPWACSTSAPPRSCRRCWATWAVRAAASWPCAGTPPSRARPTSPPCSTCCPGTCRCRSRTTTAMTTWTATSRPRRPRTGSGPTPATTWSACSRRGGATRPRRTTTSATTTCPG